MAPRTACAPEAGLQYIEPPSKVWKQPPRTRPHMYPDVGLPSQPAFPPAASCAAMIAAAPGDWVEPNQSVKYSQKFRFPYDEQSSPVPPRAFSDAWFGRYGV